MIHTILVLEGAHTRSVSTCSAGSSDPQVAVLSTMWGLTYALILVKRCLIWKQVYCHDVRCFRFGLPSFAPKLVSSPYTDRSV